MSANHINKLETQTKYTPVQPDRNENRVEKTKRTNERDTFEERCVYNMFKTFLNFENPIPAVACISVHNLMESVSFLRELENKTIASKTIRKYLLTVSRKSREPLSYELYGTFFGRPNFFSRLTQFFFVYADTYLSSKYGRRKRKTKQKVNSVYYEPVLRKSQEFRMLNIFSQ